MHLQDVAPLALNHLNILGVLLSTTSQWGGSTAPLDTSQKVDLVSVWNTLTVPHIILLP